MFSKDKSELYSKYALISDLIGFTDIHISLEILEKDRRMSKPHYHTKKEEFFYIISGTVSVMVGESESVISEGECIGFSPQKEEFHYIVNKSDLLAKILVVSTKDKMDKIIY